MREMVRNGEADALVPERVMQEISRGLMEAKPSRMSYPAPLAPGANRDLRKSWNSARLCPV